MDFVHDVVSLSGSLRILTPWQLNLTFANAANPPAILAPSLLSGEVVVTGAGGVSPDEMPLGIERLNNTDSRPIVYAAIITAV